MSITLNKKSFLLIIIIKPVRVITWKSEINEFFFTLNNTENLRSSYLDRKIERERGRHFNRHFPKQIPQFIN